MIKRCPHSSSAAFIFYHTLVSAKKTNMKQRHGILKKKKKMSSFVDYLKVAYWYVGGPTHLPAEPSVEWVYQHTTYHFEANPFSTRCLAYFYQHIQDYYYHYHYQPDCKHQLVEQNAINPKAPAGKAIPRRKR